MKIQRIEISFPAEVELTDQAYDMISTVVDGVCNLYQENNPTRVMWLAGEGCRSPLSPDPDTSTLAFEAAEREDLYGQNPLNPEGERLQKEAQSRQQEKHKTKSGQIECLKREVGFLQDYNKAIKENRILKWGENLSKDQSVRLAAGEVFILEKKDGTPNCVIFKDSYGTIREGPI